MHVIEECPRGHDVRAGEECAECAKPLTWEGVELKLRPVVRVSEGTVAYETNDHALPEIELGPVAEPKEQPAAAEEPLETALWLLAAMLYKSFPAPPGSTKVNWTDLDRPEKDAQFEWTRKHVERVAVERGRMLAKERP